MSKRLVVGMVTTGQTPREDVIPDIKKMAGIDVNIFECGALDGLNFLEINSFAPMEGEYTLMGRLRDGTQVELARDRIIRRMQKCVDRLVGQGADLVVILCFGKWPGFSSEKFVLDPSEPLRGFTLGLLGQSDKLGIIIPSSRQIDDFRQEWSKANVEISVVSASPYSATAKDEVERAAASLKQVSIDVVAMVCPGYTLEMKNIVKEIVGKPVVLARSVLAWMLKELLY